MTANIAQMMDEKLEKMALDIKANISQSLKEVTERVGEAEQRILVVENTSTDAEKRLLALEKTANELRSVSTTTKTGVDAKTYGS